jgi:hypothetical protein
MSNKQISTKKKLINSLIETTTIFSPMFFIIIFVSLFIFTTKITLAEESINEVSSPFKNL